MPIVGCKSVECGGRVQKDSGVRRVANVHGRKAHDAMRSLRIASRYLLDPKEEVSHKNWSYPTREVRSTDS